MDHSAPPPRIVSSVLKKGAERMRNEAGSSQTENLQGIAEINEIYDTIFDKRTIDGENLLKLRKAFGKDGGKMISEYVKIFNMSETKAINRLKNLENKIQPLINSRRFVEHVEQHFDEKVMIISIRFLKTLMYIMESLNINFDSQSLRENLQNDFNSMEFSDFKAKHPNAEDILLPTDKIIDRSLLQNDAEICKLERISGNQDDLEKLLQIRIGLLIDKATLFIYDEKFGEALKILDDCNDDIKELFKKWDWEDRQILPYELNWYDILEVLHGSSSAVKRKYLRQYLKRDLDRADEFRGMPTPRKEQVFVNCAEYINFENIEENTKLKNEFSASPFKYYLARVMGESINSSESETPAKKMLEFLKNPDTIIVKENVDFINNGLNVLSDLVHYSGDFQPWAKALIKAGQQEGVSGAADNLADNLIEFQSLVQRLNEAYLKKDVITQIELQKTLRNDKKFDWDLYRLVLMGYANITEDAAKIRFNLDYQSKTMADIRAIQQKQTSELLPDAAPLGRRMELAINQASYALILKVMDNIFSISKIYSARLNILINEELLQSQALNQRIQELEKVEIPDVVEEPPDDLVDEFSESDVEQLQLLLQSYQKQHPSNRDQQAQRPQGQNTVAPPQKGTTEALGTAARRKPAVPKIDNEIDNKINRYITVWWWKELSGGIKTQYAVPGILMETQQQPVFLSAGVIKHILKDHYFNDPQTTSNKPTNTSMDSSIKKHELLPMFKEVCCSMNKNQHGAHYAKMKQNASVDVWSLVEGFYKNKSYRVCLKNNRILTIYPGPIKE